MTIGKRSKSISKAHEMRRMGNVLSQGAAKEIGEGGQPQNSVLETLGGAL